MHRALGWEQVLAWRASRSHLRARAARSRWLDVVRDVAGLHAQVMSSAELTLWARVEGVDELASALWEDRTLVKTWAMRGTLHLLPADELGVWVAAQSMLKPRHETGAWLRYHGLTAEQAEAMLEAIPQALDGRMLTREELAVEVSRLTGVEALDGKLRGGFGDLLKPAAFRGELCFAPSEGRAVRFTRPDQWLDSFSIPAMDDAAVEVARRYLSAYGPASRETFARWFGSSSPAQSGKWLARLGDELAEVEVDGAPLVMLAADVEECAAAAGDGAVRLLPAFDHYVVAAPRDVDTVLPAASRDAVYRAQGWISPVLVVDGRIRGVWSSERFGSGVAVEIAPFSRVSRAVKAGAKVEAEALAAFMGGELKLTWA